MPPPAPYLKSGSAGAGRRASCRVAALPLGVSYAPFPAAVTPVPGGIT